MAIGAASNWAQVSADRRGKHQHAALSALICAPFLFLLFLLAACTPAKANPAWQWDDLRALDPVDSPSPATDLTAVYLREQMGDLQIRLDLLDLSYDSQYDYLLYLWDAATFAESPLVISVPWDGVAEVLDTGICTAKIIPRLARDFRLDTVTVSLRRSNIGPSPHLDVLAVTPGNSIPDDELRNLALEGTPPRQAVKLLFAFDHTFNGATPALALRSWDGAHTGPRGERHGLRYLLNAAEAYNFHLVLFDLTTPVNLPALEAVGALPQVQRMSDQLLLDYPQDSLAPATFTVRPQPEYEPTMDGPSLRLRAALVAAALSNEDEPFIIGGNLQQSTWASPDYVSPSMAYLAARPYIQPLSREALRNRYGQKFTGKFHWPSIPAQPLDRLVSDANTLFSRPAANQNKQQLQDIYRASLIPPLEQAVQWANEPSIQLECDNTTCIWADSHYFAVFKLMGARLEFLFYNDGQEVHQIIGPTAQFIVGLSDSSVWDLSLGELADSQQVMGAFADQDNGATIIYEPRSVENGLAFVRPDAQRVKIFEFLTQGLKVTFEGVPTATSIPLTVDPWRRYVPGWTSAYQQDGTSWGLADGLMVRIQTPVPVSLRSFNESLELLRQPEDPDLGYPDGNFVPFPMAIADIPPIFNHVTIWLTIEIKK